ncbi:PspC domain-containing protein [Dokdonia sinensis]|uniref:PspC domain-containing protein n=1 Tax=Dokdonia sinensis TaxID=2479847 RepID=A0A3M0GI14_9FLAO|nr:PspC domain-containing protein [Dokdonia sinensis]RMB63918.1 PspC domain-containing protein [Dokdonia sinensis]
MNKTVNINLAGVFFHIDEDAYGKLRRYLAAIKRSFEGMQGEDEIIADIEARISELFTEKIKDARQVISIKELDEVITVMGQPEDYMVDDDIFEDAPKQKSSYKESSYSGASTHNPRKLYRDTENAYLGGVSAGMGHYLGVDALWVRIGWILLIALTWFTLGGTALIYLALWIFVPEATTTAQKLSMRGKAVNIDNITEKVKEGFENVADAVKNVDYDKYGNKVKSGTQGFFNTLGKIIMFFFKVLAKIIGVLLIIVGATVVISLLITFLTGGMIEIFNPGLEDMPWVHNSTDAPIWLILLLTFFAVGIPFFFLFYLGLKILSSNLKSMPMSAKLSLFGLWLISTIALGVLSIDGAMKYADMDTGKVTDRSELAVTANDTLRIVMRASDDYDVPLSRSSRYIQVTDNNGERTSLSRNVRLIVRSTPDSIGNIVIEKRADASNFEIARDRANSLTYNYELRNGTLELDGFFTRDNGTRYGDQEIRVILYLPEDSTVYADDNTYSFHSNDTRYRDILDHGMEETYMKVGAGELLCKNCPDNDRNAGDRNSNTDDWQERSYERGDEIPDWEREDTDDQILPEGTVIEMATDSI